MEFLLMAMCHTIIIRTDDTQYPGSVNRTTDIQYHIRSAILTTPKNTCEHEILKTLYTWFIIQRT